MKTILKPLACLAVTIVCIINSAYAQLPDYVPAGGLIAYYGFNGNGNDLSGNGNTGTVSGPAYITDRYGNTTAAVSFTGTGDVVTTHKIDRTTTNTFSYSVWVSPVNSTTIPVQGASVLVTGFDFSAACIIDPVNGWNWSTASPATNVGAGLYVGTNGVFVLEHGPGVITAQLAWTGTLTGWHHVAVVYTSQLPKLYIDGSYVQTGVASGRIVHPSVACDSYLAGGSTYPYLYAGFGRGINPFSGLPVPTDNFTGDIDDIAIYNRALTTCEITQLYDTILSTTTITGVTALCATSAITLSNASPGGTWSSSNPGVATVGSGSGIVTGVSGGTSTINYLLGSGCSATTTVSVTALPSAITGVVPLCTGASATLGYATAGGTWSVRATGAGIASVDPVSGAVTGLAAGTATISYTVTLPCGTAYPTAVITVNPLPAITGAAAGVCSGATVTLSAVPGSGTWSSGSTGIATIASSSGAVTGVLPGTSVITYTSLSGCVANATVTINPLTLPITGTAILCAGATTTLSDATTGGTWSSGNLSVASAGTGSGIITGGSVSATGTAIISYTAPGGCATSKTVTVTPTPTSISGTSGVCSGSVTTLFDGVAGGTWSSSNPAVATVGTASGAVTGVAAGTSTMIYTLSAGCTAASVMTVYPSPSAITGTASTCIDATTTLSDSTAGGIWTSSDATIASVDALSGAVTAGSAPGSATISYTLSGCTATTLVTVNIGPLPISGTLTVCAGAITYLNDAIGSGSWSSSSAGVATVDPVGGIVYGVAAGTAVIAYSIGSCTVTAIVTVDPLPFLIVGTSAVCVGQTTPLTDISTGGTWSGGSPFANVNSATGVVTGVSSGAANITYTLPGGCAITKTMTVNTSPGIITGITHVCTGLTTVLGDAGGGNWSSSNTTIATAGTTTGVVSGITAGTVTITYSLGLGCTATTTVTVNALPPAITGTATVCAGSMTTLSDGAGTWSSGSAAIATAGSATGIITGVSGGAATITFTATTGCTATKIVTVNPLPSLISGVLSVCPGAVTTLSDITSGGTWSSGSTAIATVGTTGIVSGAAPGTSIITYTLGTGCSRSTTITVNPLPATITGTLDVCVSSATTLGDATSGGAWSGSGTFAGVTTTGVVNGLSAGTAVISYTLGTGCTRTATVTVNPLPAAITGPTAECVGAAITESESLPGGTWSSGTTSVATIGSTGIVSGVATGTTVILYTSAAGCKVVTTVTVSLSPTAIIGASAVCSNDTATLSDAVGGGAWSSSNVSAATIGSLTGLVTGAAAGTTTITYSLGTGCTQTKIITVNAAPAYPIATGAGGMSICIGAAATLSDATTGGVWSPATGSIASVSGTGVVTGATAGTAAISYTLSGTGCMATATVTVNPTPSAIGGTAEVCAGAATTLSNTVPGGSWASSNTAIATAGSTGIITGASAGTATITYSLGAGCAVTRVVTVNAISAITGSTGICLGASTTLSDAVTGGTWGSPAGGGIIITTAATGAVSGTGAGEAVVTYTTAAGCMATATVTVNLAPSAISGTLHVCAGATTALGNAAGGGTWTSSAAAIATAGVTTGIVTGIIPGTATITYSLGFGCTTMATVTVNPAPLPVTGATAVCAGSVITLSDATTGGTWSSVPLSVATITGTGIVRGVTAGTAVISYTLPAGSLPAGCMATAMVTVNPLPTAISGGGASICIGLTTALTDAASGGAWSSPDLTVGVSAATGVVTGESAGPGTITYTLPTGCIATTGVVVNAAPAAISGATGVCIGSSTALTNPLGGGTWASSDMTVAVVTASGVVTGMALGTSTISYTIGGCPATVVVTVQSLPAAIGGASRVCAGAAITLTDASGGGTWSSSSTGIATADMSAGIITGVAAGVATVTYSLGAGCTVTIPVTVDPVPGPISGVAEVCTGYTSVFSDATGGGVWSSSNTALASVTAGGIVTGGPGGGLASIYYTFSATGCAATREISVVSVPPIAGVSNMCAFGPEMTVSDASTGGVWTSTSASVSSAGVVTAYSAGAASITYTLSIGCYTTSSFTINPEPGPVMGTSRFCLGLTTTLSDTTMGGTWSSTGLAVGIATAGTGVIVTGLAAGTATISYTIATGCTETATVMVDTFPSAGVITGLSAVCSGSAIVLTDLAAGGAWSSSNALASVTGGIVAGIHGGADTIRYTVSNSCGAAAAAKTITVNPLPAAGIISGPVDVCTGNSIILSDAASGGAWSISNASATVSAGRVSGVAAGMDTVKYTVTNGCGTAETIKAVTINTLPDPSIISGGIDSICIGIHIPLLDTATGGVWSSSNAHISITGAGALTALTAGTDTITYSLTNSCGTTAASITIAVATAPAAGIITGLVQVCTGAADTLAGTPHGGAWSSSDADATIIPTAAGVIINGVSAGADTIIYTITNDCGSAVAAYPVMVMQCDSNSKAPSPTASSGQAGEVLRVFPNPNDGVFTVILSSAVDEAVQVTIMDIAGQKMKEFTTITNKAADIKFDAASGVYFLSAVTAQGKYVAKVTVE